MIATDTYIFMYVDEKRLNIVLISFLEVFWIHKGNINVYFKLTKNGKWKSLYQDHSH